MGTRADNGDGSCRQVKTGRFAGQWRVQYIVIEPSGVKKRLSRIFSTQREAKDYMRDLKRSVERGVSLATKELTFGEWFEWLAANDWPETLDSKTVNFRIGRYRKFAQERWSRVPLTKIDPMDVKAFYIHLKEQGVGEYTRLCLKAELVRAFYQAISPYRRVPHYWSNPFALDMPVPKRREAVALTPSEARAALSATGLSDSERAMLALFLLSGLRLGEQMALTRGQIDVENGQILVSQSVHLDAKGKQELGSPKGGKVRSAVLCRTLWKYLQPIVAHLASSDFLWSQGAKNKPLMKKQVYTTWRRIRLVASLPESMSPHDCRLTHINWIEKLCPNVSTTTLKEHVGHAAEGVTEVNYTRPLTTAQHGLREALDGLMSGLE